MSNKTNHHPNCHGDNCDYGAWCACDCHRDKTIQHGDGRPALPPVLRVPEPELRAQARRASGFVSAQLERDIVQDEALRGLLSYCETQAPMVDEGGFDAYTDVADKLKGILDGER